MIKIYIITQKYYKSGNEIILYTTTNKDDAIKYYKQFDPFGTINYYYCLYECYESNKEQIYISSSEKLDLLQHLENLLTKK